MGCFGVFMKSGSAVAQLCCAPCLLDLCLEGVAEVKRLPLIFCEFKGKGQGFMLK